MTALIESLPEPWMILRLGPWLACLTVLAAIGSSRLRSRGVRAPYSRKLFHFVIFTAAAAIQQTWGLPAVTLFGTIVSLAVLHAVWRGDGFGFYEALARPTDRPHRSLFILVPLATTILGGILSNLLFAPCAFVGYLACGWGDAVGEPVGTRFGRHRYRVPSLAGVAAERSLEGSTAVWFAASVAATLGLAASGQVGWTAGMIGLASGSAAAVVEAGSHHGLDNCTVPLAASGTACWLLGF